MKRFDYRLEAALYCGKFPKGRNTGLKFRRFDQASEAIRFAVEELAAKELGSCLLEVDDERYFGKAIKLLYEHADFPLHRRSKTRE